MDKLAFCPNVGLQQICDSKHYFPICQASQAGRLLQERFCKICMVLFFDWKVLKPESCPLPISASSFIKNEEVQIANVCLWYLGREKINVEWIQNHGTGESGLPMELDHFILWSHHVWTDPISRRLVRAWKPFNGLQVRPPDCIEFDHKPLVVAVGLTVSVVLSSAANTMALRAGMGGCVPCVGSDCLQ